MFGDQQQPAGQPEPQRVGPEIIAHRQHRKRHRNRAEERQRQIGHHHRHVRGHGRIEQQNAQRSNRDRRIEKPAQQQSENHEQNAVKGIHGDARTMLHRLRVAADVHRGFGILALLVLAFEVRRKRKVQDGRRGRCARDELYERWMFGVHAKIVEAQIRRTSRDVVGLIECEAVQRGGPPRAQHAAADNEHHKNKEVALHCPSSGRRGGRIPRRGGNIGGHCANGDTAQ